MYVVLIYDIKMDLDGPRIWRRIFKICKRYMSHIQKSVFEGNLSELELMKLKNELDQYTRMDRDSVVIFISRNERWLEKRFWGVEDEKTSNFL
ncbi:CRISPR-associated endonuclease Cas2 [Fusibacter ferrireducens]|uniref:CRISPR-associated endoribonuclease Cas2 n=1 Tax=Fusibacter ferrireducens TaxID=2785058 RepID=A0ABR9ZU78_9FIRM|nr:CRISPR-associated endonuclease Cas2 [Fusibacter ferrireducens]MBF4693995.1 CRISPR-associated endonuclease Cas2 [Fusibacter ferrireducens]